MNTIGQQSVRYHDLRSTVYVGEVPRWVTHELPLLYESCFAVLEYFTIYDSLQALSACVLDEPRHIVLYEVRGCTAVVMNQLFDIEAGSARRVISSIFRSDGRVRRVRFNGSRLDFATLGLPSRVLAESSNVAIPLPGDMETYLAGLGSASRHKARNYMNRFARKYPDYEFRVVGTAELDEACVHRVIEMSRERMASKGEVSLHTEQSEARLVRFLRSNGFATTMTIQGRVVAGALGSRVGTQRYLNVQAFDGAFAKDHLGWVHLLFTIRASIEEGATRLHLLWGRAEYKSRLGGAEEHLHAACVYRSRLWWAACVDDVTRAAAWSWRRGRLAKARAALAGRLRRWVPRHSA